MEEVVKLFNANDIRYLLLGGQAMRLLGMPRFSMDWDFYIPPRDAMNFARINELLADELDTPLIPLGERGENFIQTYQTSHGVLQFHLIGPGLPKFTEADAAAVVYKTENGVPVRCLSGSHLLRSKLAADRDRDLDDIAFLRELESLGKLA